MPNPSEEKITNTRAKGKPKREDMTIPAKGRGVRKTSFRGRKYPTNITKRKRIPTKRILLSVRKFLRKWEEKAAQAAKIARLTRIMEINWGQGKELR
jgi:hypothetical protein